MSKVFQSISKTTLISDCRFSYDHYTKQRISNNVPKSILNIGGRKKKGRHKHAQYKIYRQSEIFRFLMSCRKLKLFLGSCKTDWIFFFFTFPFVLQSKERRSEDFEMIAMHVAFSLALVCFFITTFCKIHVLLPLVIWLYLGAQAQLPSNKPNKRNLFYFSLFFPFKYIYTNNCYNLYLYSFHSHSFFLKNVLISLVFHAFWAFLWHTTLIAGADWKFYEYVHIKKWV